MQEKRNKQNSSYPVPCTKRGTLAQIGKSLHRIKESRYTETTDTDQTHASEQGEPHPLHYREELPPDCPPESATEITEATTRYRLLRNSIPEENDFDSYARQRGSPNPRLRRTPCEQHGVSLMTSLQGARNLMASQYNRGRRWQAIGVLTIPPGAGRLNPVEPGGHQTWWPNREFNPSEECRTVG